jgi:osmotically-inducible protein OsmY
MYFLDPRTGKRRRALLRDQAVKLKHTAEDQADDLSHYSVDKARGAVHETSRRLRTEDVADDTLVARVRSAMGRYTSHPSAIEVMANNGRITLRGNILATEVQPIVSAVKTVPGVKRVENQLQVHEKAANIPDLQGGRTPTELR